MKGKQYFLKVGVCILAAGAFVSAGRAQGQQAPNAANPSATGSISGRVTGADMQGATVVVTNVATGTSQTAVADANANFTFRNLPPGSYRVAVRPKSGITLGEKTVDLTAANGQQVVVFTIDNSGTPAELQAKAPTLQTETAEVSREYGSVLIRTLPVLDRQNHELVSLMPGITPPDQGDRIVDPQRTRAFNVNGQPAWANLFNQDGAYDNEPFSGRPLRVEPNEAVEALQVRTSNYTAEYGLAGGSSAINVTRPGTNAIHGSLFAFHNDSFLRSGRTLNATQTSPRYNMNQFGGTAGGAIIPDNMFWFLSYEGFLQRGNQEAVATVPTVAARAGNFSGVPGATIYNPFTGLVPGTLPTQFTNNTIPVATLNPAAVRIANLVPLPNLAGTTNNLVGHVPLLDDTHRMDGKIDHRFAENSTGFLRYGFTQSSVNQGSLLGATGSPLEAGLRTMNAVAGLTHVFTPTLTGDLLLSYNRYRNQIAPWGNFAALGTLGAVGFPNGLPSINISGFTPLGFPVNVPSKQIDNTYDGATNWNWHTGINSLKFGLSARELQVNGITNPFFGPLGSFTFGPGATLATTASGVGLTSATLQANSFAGFLTGTPGQAGITTFQTTPAYRQRQYAAYLTDTINIFQRLWLEIGARYDIFSPLEAAQPGGAILFNPATNTTSVTGLNSTSSRINRYDLNNIAPRVGLTFRPLDRLVIRAGYGILYFPAPFSLAPFNPAALSVQNGIAGGRGITTFTTPLVPTAGATAANTPFFVGPRDYATPFLHTYSLMIQGDLGNGFLLDVGYVGNRGRQLPYNNVVTGAPGTGLGGLPIVGRTAPFFERAPGLTSNYNSGQVNLTKRFAAGLTLTGAYTYSKALDYGYNLLNPFSRASNYGPADWDRTHIMSVTHDWRLPFGVNRKYLQSGWAARILGDWELTGIIRWATGTPYSITTDPLACACLGVSAVPAAFAANATGTSLAGAGAFDPTQFVAPAAGTFGSATRNSFRGPDFFNYNAALFRNFAVNENVKIELRGEAYNVTNTTNLRNPVSSLSSPGFGSSLGNVNGTAGRQFQVGARLLF